MTDRSPSEESGCKNKSKFTYQQATTRHKKQRRRYSQAYSFYLCPFKCKLPDGSIAYHVGHPSEGRRKHSTTKQKRQTQARKKR